MHKKELATSILQGLFVFGVLVLGCYLLSERYFKMAVVISLVGYVLGIMLAGTLKKLAPLLAGVVWLLLLMFGIIQTTMAPDAIPFVFLVIGGLLLKIEHHKNDSLWMREKYVAKVDEYSGFLESLMAKGVDLVALFPEKWRMGNDEVQSYIAKMKSEIVEMTGRQ